MSEFVAGTWVVHRDALPARRAGVASAFAFWTLVYLLFSFKIAIVRGVGNGLRVDDFVLGVAALALAVGWLRKQNARLSGPEKALFVLVGVEVFTAVVAATAGRVSLVTSLLFAVRPVEYWIAYRLVRLLNARDRGRFAGALRVYALFLSVLAVGQIAGVFGGVTRFSLSRASGNLGGPYELAAVSAGLLIFFAARSEWKYAVLAVVPLLLSESRSTVVAVVVIIPFLARGLQPRVRALALSVAAVIAVGVLAGLTLFTFSANGPTAVAGRLQDTSLTGSWQSARDYTATVPRTTTQALYDYYGYSSLGQNVLVASQDSSAFVRYLRWQLLIRAASSKPSTTLLGLGPSFAGLAVDGNYIRVFAESGVLGLLALVAWLIAAWRAGSPQFVRPYLLVLLLTGFFIDIFVSYKACLFLWAFLALGSSEKEADMA